MSVCVYVLLWKIVVEECYVVWYRIDGVVKCYMSVFVVVVCSVWLFLFSVSLSDMDMSGFGLFVVLGGVMCCVGLCGILVLICVVVLGLYVCVGVFVCSCCDG